VQHVDLHLTAPEDRLVPMERGADGCHRAETDAPPGTRYLYRLDGRAERPDPASRAQPDGVHRASMVVDLPPYIPPHGWRGRPMRELIIYELHIGTFSAEGTFDGAIPHLERLAALGITAIEIMPVAAFPGARNWGYDGVLWYAAQESYGGVHGLRRLIEACHAHGIAVLLDVVYNHIGPEGNYLREFAPYFTDRYVTPWGAALNFDGRGSDAVRAFVLHNLRWWVDVGVDGFRLDAVQEIYDMTATHILRQMADAAAAWSVELGREIVLIAESNLNDPRLTDPPERNGHGLHAEWSDDFHHALHSLLTGERMGYYADFGSTEALVRALRDGYTRTGGYSHVHGRAHGRMPAPDAPGERFVIFAQNHDQVGNRLVGDRLTAMLPAAALRLLAGLVLLPPYVPLLFMGEEYGETAPFPFFVDHGDAHVIDATRRGRAEQMRDYGWAGTMPDPAAEATFASAKLDHALRERGAHAGLYALYARLIALRREHPALATLSRQDMDVTGEGARLTLHRWHGAQQALAVFNLSAEPITVAIPSARDGAAWSAVVWSWAGEWGGDDAAPPASSGSLSLPGYGFVLYTADVG
jgi:maltooligosyltrehalose trehalohydrolase